MATTTYRFVGEAPEVFADFSSAFTVAGRQDDPNAPDFQQPGELRPGQEFEGPAGVEHVRIERKMRSGKWTPTLTPGPDSDATVDGLDTAAAPPTADTVEA